jgi:predicted aspartyl protease
MGLTYVTATVKDFAGKAAPFEDQFLVDTGAIDCMVDEKRLEAAGVSIDGKDSYELADGSLVELPYAHAWIEFMDMKTVSRVIFGPKDCEPIMGVVVLESVGFGVDPVTKTLCKMVAKPLK